MEEHLVIIIDDNKVVEPKKYSCLTSEKTKDQAIQAAKKAYENKHNNFNYQSYHFIHKTL